MTENVVNVQTMSQVAGLKFDAWFSANDGKFGRLSYTKGQLNPLGVGQRHFRLWRQPEIEVKERFGAFQAFAKDVKMQCGRLLQVPLKVYDLVQEELGGVKLREEKVCSTCLA
jgi:hypothetical protein